MILSVLPLKVFATSEGSVETQINRGYESTQERVRKAYEHDMMTD